MRELTEQIKEIDLAGVIRDAGVELQNRGGRWTGLCPFHSEKTPSFQVYQDRLGKWQFHCFGCGAHGDAVDFLQRLHGLDFHQALAHLGIEQSRNLSFQAKQEIKARSRRRELVEFFKEWERAAVHHFSVMVRATRKAMTELTPENFNQYADIMQPLSTWEYWLDILISGDDSEKFSLFQEHRANRTKLIRRKNLFRPDFDFKRWLREKDQIHG
jgi:hypothetical protein